MGSGDAGIVVAGGVVDDDLAARRLNPMDVGDPRPVGSGVLTVLRLQLSVGQDVLPVARDAAVARQIADERGRGRELRGGERGLRREARVLDAHREVVALHAVQPALVAAVEVTVVQRRDVPRPVALQHQLRNLGPALVDHVVRAHLRYGIHEPAPAARVVAFAGVDDHGVDQAGRIRGALIEIGRGSPRRGPVVGRARGVGRLPLSPTMSTWCRRSA